MEIALKYIIGLIVILYIGWINTSIREMKQKLSNIEELLKNKEN
jgi:hypothetical protein